MNKAKKNGIFIVIRKDPITKKPRPMKITYKNGKEVERHWVSNENLTLYLCPRCGSTLIKGQDYLYCSAMNCDYEIPLSNYSSVEDIARAHGLQKKVNGKIITLVEPDGL